MLKEFEKIHIASNHSSLSPYFCAMNRWKSNIRNIIFDLGGVLIDLDVSLTVKSFSALAIPVPADADELERRALTYSGFEAGTVSPDLFREAIRELSPLRPSNEAIDTAWNAMLSDFPEKRVKTLQKLIKNYRIFLLSNSNVIHYQFYAERFKRDYAIEMDSLFEKAYYSFEMNMCKPNAEIFQNVLEQSMLLAEETLFIDDNSDNVIAATALGIKSHQLVPGQDMVDLFRNGILI